MFYKLNESQINTIEKIIKFTMNPMVPDDQMKVLNSILDSIHTPVKPPEAKPTNDIDLSKSKIDCIYFADGNDIKKRIYLQNPLEVKERVKQKEG